MMRGFLQPLTKACLIIALLIGQVLSVTGLPASWFAHMLGKDRSVPFPCMYRGCGCKSAYDCWVNCCCFSPQERLAWAKGRGIEALVQTIPSSADCCHRRKDGCDYATHEAAQNTALCHVCASCEDENEVGTDSQDQERWHPILVQKCRGQFSFVLPNWLALVDWPDLQPINVFNFPGFHLEFPDEKRPLTSALVLEPPPR